MNYYNSATASPQTTYSSNNNSYATSSPMLTSTPSGSYTAATRVNSASSSSSYSYSSTAFPSWPSNDSLDAQYSSSPSSYVPDEDLLFIDNKFTEEPSDAVTPSYHRAINPHYHKNSGRDAIPRRVPDLDSASMSRKSSNSRKPSGQRAPSKLAKEARPSPASDGTKVKG